MEKFMPPVLRDKNGKEFNVGQTVRHNNLPLPNIASVAGIDTHSRYLSVKFLNGAYGSWAELNQIEIIQEQSMNPDNGKSETAKAEPEILQVRKDRVLEAARTCPDVARAMKALFPEAFAPQITMRVGEKRLEVMRDGMHAAHIAIRNEGEYRDKGFFLHTSSSVSWEIVTDSQGAQVLIPRIK
jgi:hypothetical protein